jgi:hypothetical protein
MQRVNATACEIRAVAVLVEPLVPLVGRLAPQAATSRARVVVLTMTAAVRPAGSAARRVGSVRRFIAVSSGLGS